MKRNNSMKSIIATLIFLVVVAVLVLVYLGSQPKPADDTKQNNKQDATIMEESTSENASENADTSDATATTDASNASEEQATEKKTITVQVVIPDEEMKEYSIATDAAFLRQALDQEKLIEGKDSGFGFFITGVNGRVADDSKQEWWCITKKGEQVNYGVDQIVLEDGDQYEITLTVGY